MARGGGPEGPRTARKAKASGTGSLTFRTSPSCAPSALAAGVPVVAPATGVFPEMLELTGGGLLVEPENAAALAEAIARLQDNPEEADRMGTAGAEGITRHYGVEEIVAQTVGVYEEAIGRGR